MPKKGLCLMNEEVSESLCLSIVVPVYKVEQYIHKCIDSILEQSFKDFELILVDDGSTDNCGNICEEYAEKDYRIRVIHQANAGLSAARNTGIEVASGKYITFVDSDDWIDNKTYEKAFCFLRENQLEVACYDIWTVKGTKIKFKPRYPQNKIFVGVEGVNAILEDGIDNSAWNKIYLKKLFDGIRYPKGRVYEDVATVYKVLAKAERVGYLKQPLYYYLKRGDSIVGTSFNSSKRYDAFIGYKERFEYAKSNALSSIESCRVHAISVALATLTTNYIDHGLTEAQFARVTEFIECNKSLLEPERIKGKNKFLLFAFSHCTSIHKLYANLSFVGKKIQRRFY